MSGGTTGEELPAAHDNIDISGVELEPAADPTGHLGGDQVRAGAEKRVIDYLAGPAVVGDRAAHALDRLLGPVPPTLFTLSVAKRVIVGDLPDRRLRAVAAPVAGFALAHRVPAGLMLPVVIATAQRKVLFDPDDLSAKLQPAGGQVGGDNIAVQRPVPDISDISREQRIGLTPVGAIVVEHLALSELAGAETAARSPRWLVANTVTGRLGSDA
jgi:hypothetical protein